MQTRSVVSSIRHILLHDIIYDWLILYVYYSALNSTLHIVSAKWLSFEWVNSATYLSRISLNPTEEQLKFLRKKGNWNVILFRSVLNAGQTCIVIINLFACCLLFSMHKYGIGPDSFKWPDVYFCLSWLQVFLADSTKGQRTEWDWNLCLLLTLSCGVFSRQNIPIICLVSLKLFKIIVIIYS